MSKMMRSLWDTRYFSWKFIAEALKPSFETFFFLFLVSNVQILLEIRHCLEDEWQKSIFGVNRPFTTFSTQKFPRLNDKLPFLALIVPFRTFSTQKFPRLNDKPPFLALIVPFRTFSTQKFPYYQGMSNHESQHFLLELVNRTFISVVI